MALFVTNIGDAALLNPITNELVTVFTRMDSILVKTDVKMQGVRGGGSYLPAIHIGADRDPQVSMKGPELPVVGLDKITGMTATRGSTGSPLLISAIARGVIGPDGKAKLKKGRPLSATATTINVMNPNNGEQFTPAASAPTAGQYTAPVAGATEVQFNVADAGKHVAISYHYDSSTASKYGYNGDTIPGVHKVVAEGTLTSDIEPELEATVTIVVAKCQLDGSWDFGAERAKPTNNTVDLKIQDPGPGIDAVSIFFDGVEILG